VRPGQIVFSFNEPAERGDVPWPVHGVLVDVGKWHWPSAAGQPLCQSPYWKPGYPKGSPRRLSP